MCVWLCVQICEHLREVDADRLYKLNALYRLMHVIATPTIDAPQDGKSSFFTYRSWVVCAVLTPVCLLMQRALCKRWSRKVFDIILSTFPMLPTVPPRPVLLKPNSLLFPRRMFFRSLLVPSCGHAVASDSDYRNTDRCCVRTFAPSYTTIAEAQLFRSRAASSPASSTASSRRRFRRSAGSARRCGASMRMWTLLVCAIRLRSSCWH